MELYFVTCQNTLAPATCRAVARTPGLVVWPAPAALWWPIMLSMPTGAKHATAVTKFDEEKSRTLCRDHQEA